MGSTCQRKQLFDLEAAGQVRASHWSNRSGWPVVEFLLIWDPVCSKRRPAKPAARSTAKKAGKGKGRSLKKLIRLLLRIAGRKIWILLVVAVARTALSNRLARLQVWGHGAFDRLICHAACLTKAVASKSHTQSAHAFCMSPTSGCS